MTVPKRLREANANLPIEIRKSLVTKSLQDAARKARVLWLQCQVQLGLLPPETLHMNLNSNSLLTAWIPYNLNAHPSTEEEKQDESMRGQLRKWGFGMILPSLTTSETLREFHRKVESEREQIREMLKDDSEWVRRTVQKSMGGLPEAVSVVTTDCLPAKPNGHLPPLSARITEFIQKKKAQWKPKTEEEWRGILGMLVRIVGDIPVEDLCHEHGNLWEDTLHFLPSNCVKRGQDKGLTFETVLEKGKSGELPRLSVRSQAKYLQKVVTFMKWCKRRHYCSENHFEREPPRISKKNKTSRDYFTTQDLSKIFTEYRILTDVKGNKAFAPRFWVPLIALYTGMRLNEICQLHKDDIMKVGNHWCIDISEFNGPDAGEDVKNVKTVASVRRFPIPAALIDLGLLNFVEERRKEPGRRLFSELRLTKNGHGGKFTGWFAKFLERIELKTERKVFHSLRNTFVTAWTSRGHSKQDLVWITGHTMAESEADSYQAGLLPPDQYPRIKNALDSIDFGFDSRLLRDPKYNSWMKKSKKS